MIASSCPPQATTASTSAASAPRGRPSWSGLLRFSLVALPVKAYPAVASKTVSHFHLLHAGCGQRLQYQKRCPKHGPVTSDDIVKGYSYSRDRCVVVEPEELERLRPAKDRALVLEQFVALREIDPVRFAGRSLYLWPDGMAAQHPYGVLVAALHKTGKAALGRVVWSSQRQLVLVRPCGPVLVTDVLHYPSQVRTASVAEADLPQPQPSATELDLACQLIALADGSLDWSRYRDTSADELAALVQAKIDQQPPMMSPDEPAVLHLLEALKQSVAAAAPKRNGAAPTSQQLSSSADKPPSPRRSKPPGPRQARSAKV
jgi:DNA end-binding protein Ku